MISYAVYKIVHLTGVMMVFLAVGGLLMNPSSRRPLAMLHGFGLFLSLLGGFGLLARLGVTHGGLPGWALAKLGIWTVFALAIMAPRFPRFAKAAWPLAVVLGAGAAYIAGSKPF